MISTYAVPIDGMDGESGECAGDMTTTPMMIIMMRLMMSMPLFLPLLLLMV